MELARERPRFGYRRLQVLLGRAGEQVNHKRVHRVYREAGLMFRRKKRKHCVREGKPLVARTSANQEWALDFVHDAVECGRAIRVLSVVDAYTRECLALEVDTSFASRRVTRVLDAIVAKRGMPEAIRCDNGPEFTSRHFLAWCVERQIEVIHIQPGKPTQNGRIESFHGRLREECLTVSWFQNLFDARRKIAAWQKEYNEERPHSSLDTAAERIAAAQAADFYIAERGARDSTEGVTKPTGKSITRMRRCPASEVIHGLYRGRAAQSTQLVSYHVGRTDFRGSCLPCDRGVCGPAGHGELGFIRSEPAETGRPGYDPRDLLKLYLYGYLWQIRSSRRLETECQRNVEVMWPLGRLVPDYKSIAEFRRMHREAVAEAGAELVRFARSVGLVRGEWVAIDGSKFQSVSSVDRVREREALKRYLDQVERADEENEVVIDASAVADALEKLKSDPEPEAAFMKIGRQLTPGYNVQTAVDAKHGLIVAHKVTTDANDQRMLLPMAEAAKQAVGSPASLNVIADGGYSNGEQSETCESQGIVPYVPPKRTVNNHGDGKLFDRTEFVYDEATDTFRCPAGQTLWRKQFSKKDRTVTYTPRRKVCGPCALKARCTLGPRRYVSRHLHEGALQRMQQRTTPEVMRLRAATVELPFAALKYRIFGHPRFLLRGLAGAQTEINLATLVYNLKRMLNVLGACELRDALTV